MINQDILNEITTILNDQKLSKESIYTKARDIPRTKNLLKIGEEIDNDTNLKFPKNFVMLKEEVYKKFLENADVNYMHEKTYSESDLSDPDPVSPARRSCFCRNMKIPEGRVAVVIADRVSHHIRKLVGCGAFHHSYSVLGS